MDILLIEDDDIEMMKLQQILSAHAGVNTRVATDGLEAWEYLRDAKKFPDLILTDINMPRLNGLDFLTRIKATESLRHIPVVVLSTSKNPRDIKQCAYLGIAGYFTKPLRLEDYVKLVAKLISYWGQNLLIHPARKVSV